MWAASNNGKWVWVAAATATSAFLLTTNLGILRGVVVSWRARRLPSWPTDAIGGNLKQLFKSGKSFHQQLKAGADEHGHLFALRIVCFTVVIITDPSTVQGLLRPGPNYLPKARPVKSVLQRLTGGGPPMSIASAPDGTYHRAIRKALSPSFSPTNLKQALPDVIDLATRAVEHLASMGKQEAVVDVDNVSQRIAVDLIGRMVFGGVDFGATKFELHNEPLDITNNLFKSMQTTLNPLNRWLPFRKDARNFRYWQKKYAQLAERIARDARAKSASPGSIMSALLNLEDPTKGKKLTDAQLKAEVGILLIAGFETSAHSIAWTLLCLACHKAALDSVLEELDSMSLLASKQLPNPRAVEWSDLGKMRQLDAAINESLRLFPVVSSGPTTRQAPHDMELLGHKIPKGAFIMLPTWAIHRNQNVWGPDANEYNPQRWLEKQTGDNPVSKLAYMPFSHGPRDCVGQSLAMLELRVVLTYLLGRIKFDLAEEMESFQAAADAARQFITLQPTIPNTSPPKVGMLLRCNPRSSISNKNLV